ncbi:MAG: transposase, partial [Syntrophaceae bacterium]|nr:transposase [Syntrophaceae bacterium]
MKPNDSKILNQRKEDLAKRLERKHWPKQERPLLRAQNIHYEMAEKVRAIDCGGIGAFHLLACNSGLVEALNDKVHLLKRHLPYYESDHVLNIAYNTLTGGTCLEDIELRRNDETFMDGLGAERIPDPTTAGDFTRRFSDGDVVELMEAINSIRPKLWRKRLSRSERKEAILDVDGTHAPTWGECKEGIGLSYDGEWGYHPLLISLANTSEPLY